MFNKLISSILLLCMLVSFGSFAAADNNPPLPTTYWTDYAADGFAGGDGSEGNPYLIATEEQLAYLATVNADNYDNYGNYFKLTSDIDLSDHLWFPISPFSGTFDGNKKTIANLTINSPDIYCQGLFSDVFSKGKLTNITLIDCNVKGNNYQTGALAGENAGLIENCSATGTVEGNIMVGGLVGHNRYGKMINCFSNVEVIGNTDVGGLVGHTEEAIITNSYSRGNVSGNERVGGFVGSANSEKVSNCYSTGAVSGSSDLGGFCGKYSYSVGLNNYPSIEFKNNYYDATVNPFVSDEFTTGTTTTEMQNIAFADLLNKDGDIVWRPDTVSNINNGYPILIPITYWTDYAAEGFTGGDGSDGNPYLIGTAEELAYLSKTDFYPTLMHQKHFKLTANIDLAGHLWAPIGNRGEIGFNGYFDGNGKTISNLFINTPNSNEQGLFGYVVGGSIENLFITNCNIIGKNFAGALVGRNNAEIKNCSATGIVKGNEYVGGLLGSSGLDSFIANSYSSVNVNGVNCVGGFIGYEYSDGVINCYATGNVIGQNYVSSFIGTHYGGVANIKNCYSIGIVTGNGYVGGLFGNYEEVLNYYDNYTYYNKTTLSEDVKNCYFNKTVNPSLESDGLATGMMTDEMKNADFVATLGNENWKADFTNNINNGYPILQWQNVIPEGLITTTSKAVRINGNIVLKVNGDVDIPDDNLIHIALYDESNRLVDYILVPIMEESQTINSFYIVFKDNKDADFAKVFIWKQGMNPVSIVDNIPILEI